MSLQYHVLFQYQGPFVFQLFKKVMLTHYGPVGSTAFGDIVSLKILLKLVSIGGLCFKPLRLLFTVPAALASLLQEGVFECIHLLDCSDMSSMMSLIASFICMSVKSTSQHFSITTRTCKAMM
jgi:hypothetical protein